MRITNNDTMAPLAKFNVIKSQVINNALSAVEDGLKLFKDASELSNIDYFCNPERKLSIEELCSSDKEKKDFLVGTVHKDSRVCKIINECIYHPRLNICGCDELGQSSYIQLYWTIS